MNILDRANLKIKNKYPVSNDVSNFCTTFESDNLFQINFESIGCKNSYNGKCIMCDYGRGRNITKEEMLHALNFAINSIKGNPNARFMYYSQINSYDSIKKIGLLDNVICINNQELVNNISDKFELKKLFKNIVPVLDYEILSEKYCKYDYLNKKFNTSDGSF